MSKIKRAACIGVAVVSLSAWWALVLPLVFGDSGN